MHIWKMQKVIKFGSKNLKLFGTLFITCEQIIGKLKKGKT